MENSADLIVPEKRDLTESSERVNRRELPKYWEREYIHACMNEINNPMHRMLMTLLWMSGLRVTEAINVRKQDINFKDYTMTVRWLKSRKYKYRVVPIHPNLRDLLIVFTARLKNDERLFPITRQRVWQLTRKYFDGHPHQLRHSFAVNWLRCEGDIIILHRILGHSKVQTTMEYLKIIPTEQGKELLKIKF